MMRRIAAYALIVLALICAILRVHLETLSFCAAFFAAALLILSAKSIPRKVKAAVRICAIAALSLLVAATGAILLCGHDDAPAEPSDFVVVLGAQTIGQEPDITLRERLDRALSYAEAHPSAVLFVSGGQGSDELRPEGEIMKDYLERNGLSPMRIVAEPKAKNTRENLIRSRALARQMGMQTEKPVIITSDYHILRAKYIAGTLSMQPSGVVSVTENPALRVSYAVREVFAFVKAFFVATWSA